jgi:hypothetical protein
MSGRLRTRAARLMRQLDAGSGYREQIERDLTKRLNADDARLKPSRSESGDLTADARLKGSRSPGAEEDGGRATADARSAKASAERVCASCETSNDADARFCKACGQRLAS